MTAIKGAGLSPPMIPLAKVVTMFILSKKLEKKIITTILPIAQTAIKSLKK